jgi:cytochrome c oxidase subunit 2
VGPALPLFPEGASTFAARVDLLYLFLVAVSLFFSVLIGALVFVFAVRFRRRSEEEVPRAIEGDMRLEALWIGVPLVITMVVFFWSAALYFDMSRPPADAADVYVVGKQWMWKIQHPDGRREINELHLAVGRPVRLLMTSEDVIHSFYVPAFRAKMDVVPGRYTSMWFEPTRPGRYHLFCAEYCGTRHSQMSGSVIAMTPADYERWLAGGGEPGETMAARGRRAFERLRCDTCHAAGAGQRGPVLEGVVGSQVRLADGRTVTADAAYLRESILHPAAKVTAGFEPVMPTYEGQVGEEEILQLIAYIESLGQKGTAIP